MADEITGSTDVVAQTPGIKRNKQCDSVIQNAVEALSNLVAANEHNFNKDPLIGAVLDRYEIKELIDTGAWGNVYKAIDLTLGKDVAIKIVHDHILKDESNIKRFRREARLLCCLDSRHIIKILDANIEPAPYIVMEYFDGVPLDDWLVNNGPMNPQMAIELFHQLCNALKEAQAFGIVHRDLKPANILIRTFGNIVEAKIVDFGFAKCLDPDSTCAAKITSTGEVLGSPPYMSPEQFNGKSDHRSDIYSLGCVMYELLSGQPAFKARFSMDYLQKHLSTIPERISSLNPDAKLPPGLEDVIFTCLQKAPNKRYQSADLCSEDLKSVKDGLKPKYLNAGGSKITMSTVPTALKNMISSAQSLSKSGLSVLRARKI